MENFDDNEIGKLLRLKRYEQPPPGYFEDFLHEFHRRQRDELLRQPLWSVIWHRLSGSLFRLNIPSLTSYPAAAAALLICAAVLSFKIHQIAPDSHGPSLATVEVNPVLAEAPIPDQFTLNPRVTFANRSLGPDLSQQMVESASTHRASTPPRYVLDPLPVSYEPSFNF